MTFVDLDEVIKWLNERLPSGDYQSVQDITRTLRRDFEDKK
jgi:hypothetical protein